MSVWIKFLGTNDGAASPERGHAAIVVRVHSTGSGQASDRCYLFDAGEPVGGALVKAGVGFDEIDRLFLSHLHADHVGGLPMLLQGLWLGGRRKVLPIHLPAEGMELVDVMRRCMYLWDEVFRYRVEQYEIKNAVKDGGNVITPFPTTHLKSFQVNYGEKYGQACQAFCFRMETAEGQSVVYSGDLGEPKDLATALAKPTDLLITECAHFPAAALFDFLKTQPVGRVVVTHFAPMDQREAAKKLASERMGNRVSFAEDGMEIAL